jgi:hypothetical protein
MNPSPTGVSPQVSSGKPGMVAFALAEGSAEDSAELLKLMDSSTSPIFIKDSRGHYVYCSSAVLRR